MSRLYIIYAWAPIATLHANIYIQCGAWSLDKEGKVGVKGRVTSQYFSGTFNVGLGHSIKRAKWGLKKVR